MPDTLVRDLRARKLAARDQRRLEQRDRKQQRRMERRCWRTRPLGHEYVDMVNENGTTSKCCVACGKPL